MARSTVVTFSTETSVVRGSSWLSGTCHSRRMRMGHSPEGSINFGLDRSHFAFACSSLGSTCARSCNVCITSRQVSGQLRFVRFFSIINEANESSENPRRFSRSLNCVLVMPVSNISAGTASIIFPLRTEYGSLLAYSVRQLEHGCQAPDRGTQGAMALRHQLLRTYPRSPKYLRA